MTARRVLLHKLGNQNKTFGIEWLGAETNKEEDKCFVGSHHNTIELLSWVEIGAKTIRASICRCVIHIVYQSILYITHRV